MNVVKLAEVRMNMDEIRSIYIYAKIVEELQLTDYESGRTETVKIVEFTDRALVTPKSLIDDEKWLEKEIEDKVREVSEKANLIRELQNRGYNFVFTF